MLSGIAKCAICGWLVCTCAGVHVEQAVASTFEQEDRDDNHMPRVPVHVNAPASTSVTATSTAAYSLDHVMPDTMLDAEHRLLPVKELLPIAYVTPPQTWLSPPPPKRSS